MSTSAPSNPLESRLIREIQPPLLPDDRQLRPLSPECEYVQFSEPLEDAEHELLAAFLSEYPSVTLRVYSHYETGCSLDFLARYPFLKRFRCDVFELHDISGLKHLPDDVESLGLGRTKTKKHSLAFVERFAKLRSLYVEGHRKGIESIGSLTNLEELTLRSVTLPDLSALLPLKNLASLELKLGGTKDLSLLPKIGNLRYFEAWMVKGLSSLDVLADVRGLQYLFLQALKNVTQLPSLRGLTDLRRVHLETMKGLTNLQPVADAPVLEQLLVIDMGHLQPEDLRPFVGHPSLQEAAIGLGSDRKNRAVRELLPNLPAPKAWPHSE